MNIVLKGIEILVCFLSIAPFCLKDYKGFGKNTFPLSYILLVLDNDGNRDATHADTPSGFDAQSGNLL